MKVYAGIGSRSTPQEILAVMTQLAHRLGLIGWTLRSGCAPGADSAFEDGAWSARRAAKRTRDESVVARPELFLPWAGFEGRERHKVTLSEPQHEAFEIARQFHPAWDRCKQGAQRLHARNVHQILGPDVTSPVLSRFVLCWTPEGSGSGGTGQAIRIASHYEVPVFDLGIESTLDRVTERMFA